MPGVRAHATPLVSGRVIRWLWTFLWRYVVFSIVVISGARAYSWLFGYDDEVKAWAIENRPTIVLMLTLSAIIYAMYVWIDENTK